MNRRSLFKSFLGLALAPLAAPIIKDLAITTKPVQKAATAGLLNDLTLLMPHYYKSYVEKYGNEDFTMWLEQYKGEEVGKEFFWFEKDRKIK